MKKLEAKIEENAKMMASLKESEKRYNRMLDNLKEKFLFYCHDPSVCLARPSS